MSRRVMVIGLDAAPPALVFEKFKKKLPNLSHLIDNGAYGPLRSTHPPITIPAWAVMTTSKNPGKLGFYGFRHRKRGKYNDFYIVNSRYVKEKAVWDILSERDKNSIVISVPPGYPPKQIKGYWISCFITPGPEKDYTFPRELKNEIEGKFGPFIFDVPFRVEDRAGLRKNLLQMARQHYDIINYLARAKKWDFFMFVDIGVDRVQHAFWKYFDKEHHLYTPGTEFENTILEYYEYVDSRIGELMENLDEETYIIVVSDHGAKRMKGALVVNEWLEEKGYLEFSKQPDRVMPLDKAEINWDKTIAWGWGGYYARIFINVKGREPRGIVKKEDYESIREQLISDIRKMSDPSGNSMLNMPYRPEELYPVLRGDPPDLMVYFDDLYWRSAGTVGHGKLYLPENDTGPDDAVHDWNGIFIAYDPQGTINHKKLSGLEIRDVAPTILKLLNIDIPSDMEGKPIIE